MTRSVGSVEFDLSDEHEAFRHVVRAFAESEIAPHAELWDRDHVFPTDVVLRPGWFRFALSRVQDVLLLAAAAIVCPVFAAVVGAAGLLMGRFIAGDTYLPACITCR